MRPAEPPLDPRVKAALARLSDADEELSEILELHVLALAELKADVKRLEERIAVLGMKR